MNLIEFNDDQLSGKKVKKSFKKPPTLEDINMFQKLIHMQKDIENAYELTDDSNSFFTAYPDIKKIMEATIGTECFYACKLNTLFQGVPNRVVYVIKKAVEKYGIDSPNKILNSVLPYINAYSNSEFTDGEETFLVKDILENIIGKPCQLLTDSVRKVYGGKNEICEWDEVWVPTANVVALIPKDIIDLISVEDCRRIDYDKKLGIHLDGVPLRTFNNRMGITKYEFDLRESI